MSMQSSHNQSSVVNQISEDKLVLLKSTICKGATNDEFELFMHACNRTKLDPFMKQIYFVKMGGQMTIQTGIDGYRLIAERSGKYMPGKEATFVYDKAGKLFSATSYVKKLGPDNQWHEIAATAILTEYFGTGPLWKSKPHIMLAKCSESAAIRKAFPADLSGVYTKEEMEAEAHIEANSSGKSHKEIEEDEVISKEEAIQIDHLLRDEDAEYKSDLLKFYTNSRKLSTPMADFSTLPKRFLAGCLRAINKRRDERLKKQSSSQDQKTLDVKDIEVVDF